MKNKTDLIVRISAILVVALGFLSLYLKKGDTLDKELFQTLHGHASFNVVFAIIGIIMAGLLIFLWRIDRKVAKLENEMKERKS